MIVVFVHRNQLEFYSPNMPGLAPMAFGTDVVQDLELINKDGFYSLVKQWVEQQKISPDQLLIVLSQPTYFEKQTTSTIAADQQTEILSFFESMPFESLWTRVFDPEKSKKDKEGKRAVAVSKSYYDGIIHAFTLQRFTIKGVSPAFALGDQAGQPSLDAQLGDYVAKHIDDLMKYNLVDSSAPKEIHEETLGGKKPAKNTSLPLLLGVFGILIAVLVVMVVLQLR